MTRCVLSAGLTTRQDSEALALQLYAGRRPRASQYVPFTSVGSKLDGQRFFSPGIKGLYKRELHDACVGNSGAAPQVHIGILCASMFLFLRRRRVGQPGLSQHRCMLAQ